MVPFIESGKVRDAGNEGSGFLGEAGKSSHRPIVMPHREKTRKQVLEETQMLHGLGSRGTKNLPGFSANSVAR